MPRKSDKRDTNNYEPKRSAWKRCGLWVIAVIASLLLLRRLLLAWLAPWPYIVLECNFYPPPCPYIIQPVPWWVKPFLNE